MALLDVEVYVEKDKEDLSEPLKLAIGVEVELYGSG